MTTLISHAIASARINAARARAVEKCHARRANPLRDLRAAPRSFPAKVAAPRGGRRRESAGAAPDATRAETPAVARPAGVQLAARTADAARRVVAGVAHDLPVGAAALGGRLARRSAGGLVAAALTV